MPSAGDRPSWTRRRIALLMVPVLVLGSLVAWAAAIPAAQAALEVPVPYRVGYASDDVPVLAAVMPVAAGPSASPSGTGPGGGTALPAPDPTRPAEDPMARGGALVFTTHRAGHRDGDLIYRAPGTSAVKVLVDDFDDRNPQLSPNGRTIAFESDRSGQPDIWTVGVNGTGLRRITDHPGDDTWPTWSPAGDRIAFTSTRDDPAGEIYTVAATGGAVTRLTTDPAADTEPAWSSRGVIAFSTTRFPAGADRSSTVATIAATGGLVQRVVAGEQAAWSADGLRLAYVTRANDPSGDIGVVTVATGAATVVAGNRARGETHPTWNGSAVYYADVVAGNSADVWSADKTGQDRQDHTQRPGADETAPAYTLDGTRLAYAEQAIPDDSESPDMTRIVVADADGANPRPITSFVPYQIDTDPAWSPDGTMIAFGRQARDETRSVVVVRVDDGAVLATIPVPRALLAEDTQPSWSPDGRRIAFVRRASTRAPGAVFPGAVDRRVNPGGTFTVDQTIKTPAIPPKPDIVLLVDTTQSMAAEIANVQANLKRVIAEVRQTQPNAQFAVAGFKDEKDTYLYRLFHSMTADDAATQSAVDKLEASGGGDTPESWANALVELTGDDTGFRAGTSRIVVLVGDAPTHDPSNGRSLTKAISQLQVIGARLVAIDVGLLDSVDSPPGCKKPDCQKQATRVASATGGQVVKTTNPDQVSDAILTGLHNLDITVTPTVKSCDPGVSVTFDPATPTTVHGGTDVHYKQTVTISAGLVPGTVLHCMIAYPISPNPTGNDEAYLAPLTIEVNDPALPLVTVDDVLVSSQDPGGTAVTFPATAVAADGTPLVPTCVPPSGSTFPIGQTTVTCTAVDAAGISGQDTALVTVVDPTAEYDTRIWVATLAAPTGGTITITDQVDLSVHAVAGCNAATYDTGPAFSPDGTALAFAALGALCVTDTAGQQARSLLSPNDPRIEDPAWSPDGALLAYTSVLNTEPNVRSIRTVPVAGGPPTVLIETPGQAFQPAFRPLIAGLALTVTATPQQTVVGQPAITLTYTATNPTTAPASRVWLSTVIPSKAPVATPIGALAPGASVTVTVPVDTNTPLAGTVLGTITGLFPGDLPAAAVAQTTITIVALPPPTTPPPSSPPPLTFSPILKTDPPIGPPGFVTIAIGAGFPPNSTVTLLWNPGISAPTRVKVAANGTFRTQMLVFHKDQLGPRLLVASGTGFTPVNTTFLVVPGNQQPADFAVRR